MDLQDEGDPNDERGSKWMHFRSKSLNMADLWRERIGAPEFDIQN